MLHVGAADVHGNGLAIGERIHHALVVGQHVFAVHVVADHADGVIRKVQPAGTVAPALFVHFAQRFHAVDQVVGDPLHQVGKVFLVFQHVHQQVGRAAQLVGQIQHAVRALAGIVPGRHDGTVHEGVIFAVVLHVVDKAHAVLDQAVFHRHQFGHVVELFLVLVKNRQRIRQKQPLIMHRRANPRRIVGVLEIHAQIPLVRQTLFAVVQQVMSAPVLVIQLRLDLNFRVGKELVERVVVHVQFRIVKIVGDGTGNPHRHANGPARGEGLVHLSRFFVVTLIINRLFQKCAHLFSLLYSDGGCFHHTRVCFPCL